MLSTHTSKLNSTLNTFIDMIKYLLSIGQKSCVAFSGTSGEALGRVVAGEVLPAARNNPDRGIPKKSA